MRGRLLPAAAMLAALSFIPAHAGRASAMSGSLCTRAAYGDYTVGAIPMSDPKSGASGLFCAQIQATQSGGYSLAYETQMGGLPSQTTVLMQITASISYDLNGNLGITPNEQVYIMKALWASLGAKCGCTSPMYAPPPPPPPLYASFSVQTVTQYNGNVDYSGVAPLMNQTK